MWCMGLVAPQHVGSCQTRDQTRVPCIRRWILNHCATGEVLSLCLLMVSFAVQKLLSLIRSHLFIFVFIFITLGGGSKKILLRFMSNSVLPMFSSKNFIVSGLTFRSLIHFEGFFGYGVRECSDFILLHVTVQFSQHHLLKKLSFLHCILLPPLL